MDKIFAEGLSFNKPHQNAPEWVKGKVSVKVEDFIIFLNKHKNERGYVNVDLKKSQKGIYYFELDQWTKPEGLTDKDKEEIKTVKASTKTAEEEYNAIDPDSEIPF